MAEEHWSERLLDRVTRSPGLWAFLCLGLAVTCASILGIDRLDPTLLQATPTFRPYALVGVIAGLVGAIWLATIHWRSRPRSSLPEVPYTPVVVSPPPARPAIPDLIPQMPGVDPSNEPRARFGAARKAALSEEEQRKRDGGLAKVKATPVYTPKDRRIPRDPQTGELQSEIRRVGEERDEEGKLVSVTVERYVPAPEPGPNELNSKIRQQEILKLVRNSSKLSDRARLYLQHIRHQDLRTITAYAKDPTIQELVESGYLALLSLGNSRNTYSVREAAREAIESLPFGDRLSSLVSPPWFHQD